MTESPFLPNVTAPDWEAFIRGREGAEVPEIDLTTVKRGDCVIVITQGTAYMLTIEEGRTAALATNRSDRPAGSVTVQGCAFGGSSSIRPDRLFCGGNLEFIQGDPPTTYRTSAIRALQLRQAAS